MQEILSYLTDVLGLHHLCLRPDQGISTQANIATNGSSRKSLKVLFVNEKGRGTSQGADLLSKMIAAMKLDSRQAEYIELDTFNWQPEVAVLEEVPLLISFSPSLYQALRKELPDQPIYQIPSPEEMLKNSALKREAWETLKQGMKLIT